MRRRDPLHPVARGAVGAGKRQARGLVRHRRHGARHRRHDAGRRVGQLVRGAHPAHHRRGGGLDRRAAGADDRDAAARGDRCIRLVGLAAVFIGFNAEIEITRVAGMLRDAGITGCDPLMSAMTARGGRAARPLRRRFRASRSVAKKFAREITILRIEVFLGVFIGAVTFTGSVIAYGKLARQGRHQGHAASRRAHAERGAAAGRSSCFRLCGGAGVLDADPDGAAGALHRLPPDHGDRRRGHAGGRVDAEQLFGLGGGGDRVLAVERPPDRGGGARGILGRDPQLHHVQGDEPVVRERDPGRLRQHERAGGGDRGRADRHRFRRGRGGAERRGFGHHHPGLRHGGGAGAAGGERAHAEAAGARARPCASRSTPWRGGCRGT
jgi:hypothetical protein